MHWIRCLTQKNNLYQLNLTAVIDNDSLVNLSYLHKNRPFFNNLRNLLYTIYFPSKIIQEYSCLSNKEPHRDWIIQRVKPDEGFFRYCNSYDSIVYEMVKTQKGVDKGEAEAYAQLKKVNAHLIISDDKSFTKAIRLLDTNVRIFTTLHLICWMEHAGFIQSWPIIIKEVYQIRPFSSKELRESFLHVSKYLGINVSKKVISAKCSLSKLL